MFTYEPYRRFLKENNIKQEELIKKGVIGRNNASSLKNNKPMRIDILDKLCNELNCQFNDIVEHIQE